MRTLAAIIILVVGFILAYLMSEAPTTILGINIAGSKTYIVVIILALCTLVIPD